MNNDKPTKPRFVDVVDDDDDDDDVDVDVEVIDEPIDQAATQIDIQRNTRIPIDKKNGIKKDFFCLVSGCLIPRYSRWFPDVDDDFF